MEKKEIIEPVVLRPKNGVQAIIKINFDFNLLNEEYLIIQDFNDRGLGNGIKKFGLPGGAIEKGETQLDAIIRELYEEVAISFDPVFLKKIGSFTKLRPGGFTNENYLFFARLNHRPKCKTNDKKEVSKVHILTFREILHLARFGYFHEGSIRLIFHFLNGISKGSLNEKVYFSGYVF